MKLFLTYILTLLASIVVAQDSSLVCHLQEVELAPMESINSKSLEFSPTYYQNGLVFVVARERNVLVDPKTGQAFLDLMYADLSPDGTATRPISFSPNIRTQYHEGPCSFSNDGKEIFFTRSNLSGGTGVKNAKGQAQTKIYYGIKGSEDWEQIEELPFSSNEYSIAHPSLNNNGNFLVFSSNMPGGIGGMDLYVVERNENGWLQPVNLGSEINSKGNDAFPYWHPNGVLFFSSDGRGGYGGLDVYATSWTAQNNFTGLQHLEFPINSGRDDLGFIASNDGMSGYFASDRKPTKGKDDLYKWSSAKSIFCTPSIITPVLVSKELLITNESGDAVADAYIWLIPMTDEGPTMHREIFNTELVPDKEKEGSFYLRWGVSDTLSTQSADAVSAPNGRVNVDVDHKQTYAVVVQHDQYLPYVSVIPGEDLPSYIRLIQAPEIPVNCYNTIFTVYNAGGNIRLDGAKINLSGQCLKTNVNAMTNAEGNSSTCLPAGCPVKADISQDGYANHTFTFTPTEEDEHWNVYLKSAKDLTAPTAPISSGTIIVLDNIYYDFNKSAIRSSDAGELRALADILVKYPDLTIELTSHTDTRGTAEYNMELSERRSESSKSYLVLLGIDESRIETKAAGESMPRNGCIDNVPCTEAEHQYNRRTEVRITNPAQGMEVRYKSNG